MNYECNFSVKKLTLFFEQRQRFHIVSRHKQNTFLHLIRFWCQSEKNFKGASDCQLWKTYNLKLIMNVILVLKKLTLLFGWRQSFHFVIRLRQNTFVHLISFWWPSLQNFKSVSFFTKILYFFHTFNVGEHIWSQICVVNDKSLTVHSSCI